MADDYILETNGSVRTVVGLDIDYKTKKGTISTWRPHYVTNERGQLELEAAQTLNNQVCALPASNVVLRANKGKVFRDEFGKPNLSLDAGLKLELKAYPIPFLSILRHYVDFSVKQSRKSKKLTKSEELYNVYCRAQTNDVGKRRHLKRSTPRMIEDMQTNLLMR